MPIVHARDGLGCKRFVKSSGRIRPREASSGTEGLKASQIVTADQLSECKLWLP